MGQFVFNLEKYREWRKEKEKLDDKTLDIIIDFQELEDYDGCTYDYMFKHGKLIIKAWCDYVEFDDEIKI